MPRAIVMGGGLAGLSAAAALGEAGWEVDLFEARPFLGGRATSYPSPEGEIIDNCQHILLRCCVNLLDFYRRLGVEDRIHWAREFFFLEPGGRTSTLRRGLLPAPLHFTEAFLRATWLSLGEKAALGRALLALQSERKTRRDLDSITMAQWLSEKRQPPRLVERFWRQILVSAINEELDRMAASHGFQVFWLGFLAASDSYEMGVPAVPLGQLYSSGVWARWPQVRLHLRQPVEAILREGAAVAGIQAGGVQHEADAYISALSFEKLQPLVPDLPVDWPAFSHSPITGIHLWFDRAVTGLPHGTLLDRTLQWFFNKRDGRYLQLVVSASRSLVEMPRQAVIDLALAELAEFLPDVREAKLERAHVVKEIRATFSAAPGLEHRRPESRTSIRGLYLAGDWTRSGWPSTMEGAVRSGHLAADAVVNEPGRFLRPDIA